MNNGIRILFLTWSLITMNAAVADEPALYPIKQRDLWGYIDPMGSIVIAPTFQKAEPFCEGLALVTVPRVGNKYGVQAFINRDGKVVIGPGPPKNGYPDYDEWREFSQYDAEPSWEYDNFSCGFASFYDSRRELSGYIDKTGRLAYQIEFKNAHSFSEGIAWAKARRGNAWREVLIDAKSKSVHWVPKNAEILEDYSDGLTQIWNSNSMLTGYIDTHQQVVIEPKFRFAGRFSYGLAAVCPDNGSRKIGFINKQGELVIHFQFDAATNFSKGHAFVVKNGSLLSIDRTGAAIGRLATDDFELELNESVSEGLLFLNADGGWGCIDEKCRIIAPFGSFEHVSEFENGLALVRDKQSQDTGYINRKGEWVYRSSEWGEAIW